MTPTKRKRGNAHITQAKKRSLKLSRLGNVRAAKAARRAYRERARYLVKIEVVNERIVAALKSRDDLIVLEQRKADALRMAEPQESAA